MQHGQIINPEYDPAKNYVYESFVNYFNNPMLVKIKNVQQFSMYMVKIYAMLGKAYRYLIIFVPMDVDPIGSKKSMKMFEWVSLQTRTLEDHHNIPVHTYNAERRPPMDQKIKVEDRNEDSSVYKAETFPLDITLLHTRKNNVHQYHPTGTIASAIETFQTIISFNDKDI